MSRRRIATIAVAATVLFAVSAPGAFADTQKMGSALTLPYEGGVCNNNCLSVQQSQAGGALPNPILSPANGVITDWAVRTGDPDALYTLRTLTPATGNSYIATGSVAAPAPVPAGTVDLVFVYPIAVPLPIKQGQAIGVLQTNGGGAGADVGLPQNTTNGITTNVIANNFNGTFLDALGATFISDQQHELLLQATIKFCNVPDLKGLKTKAAKAALAAADCGAKVKRKETKKKKRRGKVFKQKLDESATAAPGTVVPIVVGKK